MGAPYERPRGATPSLLAEHCRFGNYITARKAFAHGSVQFPRDCLGFVPEFLSSTLAR